MSREETALIPAGGVSLGVIEAMEPRQLVTQATEMATCLAEVIEKQKLYARISGKKHVLVEGWTTLAAMCGVTPHEVESIESDGTFTSTVEMRRMSDGVAIARASAQCGMDEPMWAGRKAFARKSMAATRATGKCSRLAFSWIMVLAGYSPTPAEEMDSATVEHEAKPAVDTSETHQWTGSVEKVDRKVGPKGEDGKPQWEMDVLIGADGTRIGVKDKSVAAELRAVSAAKRDVVVEYRLTKAGRKTLLNYDVLA